jgi:hypothetical protein
VERVKTAFTNIYRKPAWPLKITNPLELDKKLAVIVDAVGVAPLIDDMRAAAAHYPESLLYFVTSSTGKSSRWEMLMIDRAIASAQADKELWAAMDSLIVGVGSNLPLQKTTPQWVVDARRRWEELKHLADRSRNMKYVDAERKMKVIESRLKNQGFSLKEEQ